MPWKICDYTDAFADSNLISMGATWLFLYILYMQLIIDNAISRYLWLIVLFNVDISQNLLTRAYKFFRIMFK